MIFLRKSIIALTTFLIIFTTKLHGFFDLPLLLLCFVFAISSVSRIVISRKLLPILMALGFFACYSFFVSAIYGAQEIIWPLKFSRTLLLAFLLYYFYRLISKKWSYESFSQIVVWSVVVHSLIIFAAIVLPDFRDSLYAVTGYIPRGPRWSRSPGLTVSFNATAIVHAVGLLFVFKNRNLGVLKRLFAAMIILLSFAFLGRFIFYISFLLILSYVFFSVSYRPRLIGVVCGLILLSLLTLYSRESTRNEEGTINHVFANINHMISPFLDYGGKGGVDKYFQEHLFSHVYFSDRWDVLLFGNSISGHIGLAGGVGETDSDLGIINSINANGILVTFLVILFYIWICWLARCGDWVSVTFVCVLSLALSFKETGFFTSHATSLLFLILYYQMLPPRDSRDHLSKRNMEKSFMRAVEE